MARGYLLQCLSLADYLSKGSPLCHLECANGMSPALTECTRVVILQTRRRHPATSPFGAKVEKATATRKVATTRVATCLHCGEVIDFF